VLPNNLIYKLITRWNTKVKHDCLIASSAKNGWTIRTKIFPYQRGVYSLCRFESNAQVNLCRQVIGIIIVIFLITAKQEDLVLWTKKEKKKKKK